MLKRIKFGLSQFFISGIKNEIGNTNAKVDYAPSKILNFCLSNLKSEISSPCKSYTIPLVHVKKLRAFDYFYLALFYYLPCVLKQTI